MRLLLSEQKFSVAIKILDIRDNREQSTMKKSFRTVEILIEGVVWQMFEEHYTPTETSLIICKLPIATWSQLQRKWFLNPKGKYWFVKWSSNLQYSPIAEVALLNRLPRVPAAAASLVAWDAKWDHVAGPGLLSELCVLVHHFRQSLHPTDPVVGADSLLHWGDH